MYLRRLALRPSAWEWPYFDVLMRKSQLTLQVEFLCHWSGKPVQTSTGSCLEHFISIIRERTSTWHSQNIHFGIHPLPYPVSLQETMDLLERKHLSRVSNDVVSQSADWWESGYNDLARRQDLRCAFDGVYGFEDPFLQYQP
jgi:hypothetical protein